MARSTNYKILKSPPYDKDAPESYWIEKNSKYFFGLITRRKIIGDYEFDNGGAIAEMPFFSKHEAKKRIQILKKC